LKRTVDRVREILSSYGPAILQESQRPPTRGRPKGEEHEFTSLMRAGANRDIGQSGYEIGGISLHLSRRRLNYSLEGTGVFITRHLLERSIERGLASWTGRLAEVEDAVLDTLGLSLILRRAFESGITGNRNVALPYGSGLIYGILSGQGQERGSGTLSISGSRIDSARDPNPFATHPTLPKGTSTDLVLRTAIDEDSLTLGQVDLRDGLARFCAQNEPVLSELRRCALWRRSVLTPTRPYEELAPVLDSLSQQLIDLMASPDAQKALRGRKSIDNGSGYEDPTTLDDSSPKPR
jgi:hypothetical protein